MLNVGLYNPSNLIYIFKLSSEWTNSVTDINELCHSWLKDEREDEKLVHEETMSFVFVSRSSLDRSSLDQQMHVLKQPNGNAVIGYNTNNMCDCVGESIFTFYCMNLHKSSLHISAARDNSCIKQAFSYWSCLNDLDIIQKQTDFQVSKVKIPGD